MGFGTAEQGGPYAKWQKLLYVLTSGTPGEPLVDVLQRITGSAAEIVGCGRVTVTLLGDSGQVEQVVPPGAAPQTVADSGAGLTVAIRYDGREVGALHLADPIGRDRFGRVDEQVAGIVAAATGAIVKRARLAEVYERRHRWLAESAELTRTLLSGEHGNPLRLVVDRVLSMADADLVAVVSERPDGQSYEVIDAAGELAPTILGRVIDAANTYAAEVIASGVPRVVTDLTATAHRGELVRLAGAQSAVFVPLTGPGVERGMLAVFRRPERPVFTPAEVEATTTFAAQMTLALQLAESRAHRERIALLDERDRIARDLHDHVIQRLFAIGLTLQATGSGLEGEAGKRVLASVDDIDDTIGQIRSTIYRLTGPILSADNSIRTRIVRLVEEMEPILGFRAQYEIQGPVDFGISDELAADCIAVVREALTNVAKHAGATRVDVSIALRGAALTLDVADDGRGMGRSSRRSGLANLRARAEQRGGTLAVASGGSGGTRLTWSIPSTDGVRPAG